MQDWKLPSQLVTTDNTGNESPTEMFLRHEIMRRVTAESDLIKSLDFIDGLKTPESQGFIARFLDKTINN